MSSTFWSARLPREAKARGTYTTIEDADVDLAANYKPPVPPPSPFGGPAPAGGGEPDDPEKDAPAEPELEPEKDEPAA